MTFQKLNDLIQFKINIFNDDRILKFKSFHTISKNIYQ